MLGYLDQHLLPLADTHDPALQLPSEYSPSMVLLSVAIAILAALVALSIADRVENVASRRGRFAWIVAGAASMGGGIWSMHFIGMLAYSLPCGISYDPLITMLSAIPGIFASGVTISVISRRNPVGLVHLLLGSLLMGAGIGAMHYAGMAAMRIDALFRYDAILVLVSVFVAVFLAFVSLSTRLLLRKANRRGASLLSAIIMGLAVGGMHYVAMAAVIVFPDATIVQPASAVSPTVLALVITVFTASVAACTLAASFAGRQQETANRLAQEMEQRTHAEQEARAGRERLQALFDSMVDGVIAFNKTGRVRQWSPSAEGMFGYRSEEALALSFKDLAQVETTLDELAARRMTETVGIRKDGYTFPLELTLSEASTDAGRGYIAVARDITDRKRAETALIQARQEADSANQAKSTFLANMSHEIRTPMNSVIGLTHLILKTDLQPVQRNYVRKIQQSGTQLLSIINDILDFSRIEAGQLLVESIDFDLNNVLEDLSGLAGERAAAKDLELVFDVDGSVRTWLRGDPLRLSQILINFVNNAIKFTDKGEVAVIVRQEAEEADAVRLKFQVRDTGIGLTPEQADRLFQSFQQADASTTRKYGGTGLGLAICARLVELMGGEYGVESEFGVGSTFWFTVKLQKATSKKPQRVLDSRVKGLRTLIADDNQSARAAVADMLQSLGCEVVQAVDGTHAVQVAKSALDQGRPIEMFFIDWRMPELDGIETVLSLRRLYGTREAHYVLVTAFGRDDVMRSAEDARLDGVLIKPISPSMLLDNMMRTLGADAETDIAAVSNLDVETLAGLHVLLVEDNELNQEVAEGLLRSAGVTVTFAGNGAVAIDLLDQESFDLVFMDMQMPVMDGLEATRRIRAQERFRDLPIIAMTANAMARDRIACIDAGMNDHVSKPINPDELFSVLRRWTAPRQGAEQHSSAPMPTPTQKPMPLEIAGLDTRAGLARALNNVETYLDRLTRYAGGQRDVGARIRQAMRSGDRATAEREAHTAKALAGNIGADELQALAGDVEAEIAQGTFREPTLERFETALAAQLVHIAAAAPSEPESIEPAPTASAESGEELLHRLHTLLSESDSEAQDLLAAHGDVIRRTLGEAKFGPLSRAIDGFDFETALSLLLPELERLSILSES